MHVALQSDRVLLFFFRVALTALSRSLSRKLFYMTLTQLIEEALRKRQGLAFDAMRLFDGAGDGLPRLVIERYGQAYRVRGGPEHAALLPEIKSALGNPPMVYSRFGHDFEEKPEGAPDFQIIQENGLQFRVQLHGSRNTGLFLDGRESRRFLFENASGRRVLNLFSYSCAFGVMAAAGGASSTVNVDSSKSALKWGKENYDLNHLPYDSRSFWASDAKDALKSASKSGALFDAIILDPPPRTQHASSQSVDALQHLPQWIDRCQKIAAPGAFLLLLLSSWSLDPQTILDLTKNYEVLARGTSGPDFFASASTPKLTALALKLA